MRLLNQLVCVALILAVIVSLQLTPAVPVTWTFSATIKISVSSKSITAPHSTTPTTASPTSSSAAYPTTSMIPLLPTRRPTPRSRISPILVESITNGALKALGNLRYRDGAGGPRGVGNGYRGTTRAGHMRFLLELLALAGDYLVYNLRGVDLDLRKGARGAARLVSIVFPL